MLCDWFTSIGLGNYISGLQRWQPNGAQLQASTDSQLEKELHMRNALHRKKLKIALKCATGLIDSTTRQSSKLDYLWVARWLDDIGLPQYKEQFIEARVDGAVLHHLTVDELLSLRVQTQLHHDSIRTGIQVLRGRNWAPNLMCRRADQSDMLASVDQSLVSTDQLCVWSSHRLMEWLRSIDLSEYVANLRGSGVHGALIVLHEAFNADLLASLLSIPPSKTLLRRHISTQFRSLIGPQLAQIKRQFEHQGELQQQLLFAKVKVSCFMFGRLLLSSLFVFFAVSAQI